MLVSQPQATPLGLHRLVLAQQHHNVVPVAVLFFNTL